MSATIIERLLGFRPYRDDLLDAFHTLPTPTYTVPIWAEMMHRRSRWSSIGRLYVELARMEREGIVRSWWGEATPERGWRRRRYYELLLDPRDANARREAYNSR